MPSSVGGCRCEGEESKRPAPWQGNVRVVMSECLATDTYRLRMACPEIARRFRPGQFLMLRLPGTRDPLLGRPLAIYDAATRDASAEAWVDVVYLVVGKATTRMTQLQAGDMLEAWGPLGNGFPKVDCDHLILVAGGIGQTPMLPVAKRAERPSRVSLCYGARTKDALAGVDDFRRTGIDVRLSTDDGSIGHHGRVTELIEPLVDTAERTHIFCCGPEAMLAATAEIARGLAIPCHVSLETPMACGMGICFSCVRKVGQPDGGWDYRRVCVDGPVFDARQLDLHASGGPFPPAMDRVEPPEA